MKLSPTREMLRPYSDLILASLDVNQVATRVGAVAEFILMNHYGWLKNGDIGNEKGYDATDKDGNKHEIKGMSYETKTHYVAYKHAVKGDKYDIPFISCLLPSLSVASYPFSFPISPFFNQP